VLNGQKQFISGAGKSGCYVVMVRTSSDGPGGISTWWSRAIHPAVVWRQ